MSGYWATHFGPAVSTLIGVLIVFASASCRTSLNADEFIASTLGGRAGEIRGQLSVDVPEGERAGLADYLAAVEAIARQETQALNEAGALQMVTRSSNEEISAAYRRLGEQSGALAARLRRLTPPSMVAAAHEAIAAAYEEQAAIEDNYANAFATLDFPTLRQLAISDMTSIERIRRAHALFKQACTPLFQQGRGLALDRAS